MATLANLDVPVQVPALTVGTPMLSILPVSGICLSQGIILKPGQHGDIGRPFNQGIN